MHRAASSGGRAGRPIVRRRERRCQAFCDGDDAPVLSRVSVGFVIMARARMNWYPKSSGTKRD